MSEKHTTRRRYITGKLVQRPGDLMNAFLDSSTTLFCAVDNRGEYVVFNKACEIITGYSYEEMAGKSFFALIAPSEHQRLREMWATRDVRDTGEVLLPWVSKAGSLHQIRWYFARFDDSGGQPEFIACVGQDVTEKLRAEHALRESEARFATVFENTSAIMFLADPAAASIVDANAAAAKFYGYSLSELRAKHIWDITRETDHKAVQARVMQAAQGSGGRVEVKHFLAGGEARDMEVHSCPIRMGDRVVLHSIMFDITERKRAEDALRQSESRFSAIFQSTSAMMFLTDPDTGKVVDANPASAAYYGWSLEELRGKHVWEINSLSREVSLQNLAKLKASSSAHIESQHKLSSGELRNVEIYTSPISVSGRILLHTIVHDVSERKRAEEALRQSEERFSAIFHGTNAIMFLTDPATGRFVDVNPACASYYGYTLEELRNKSVWDINTLEKEAALDVLKIAKSSGGLHCNFKHRLRSGEIRDVEVYSSPVTTGGRPLLHTIVHDVTARIAAERALTVSEELNRRILEAV